LDGLGAHIQTRGIGGKRPVIEFKILNLLAQIPVLNLFNYIFNEIFLKLTLSLTHFHWPWATGPVLNSMTVELGNFSSVLLKIQEKCITEILQ
jgi:hypothetical protein